MLSQLSYRPKPFLSLLTDPLTLEPRAPSHASSLIFRSLTIEEKWWAQEESNFRPRPYQGRALAS
jgi:hypothetical protein